MLPHPEIPRQRHRIAAATGVIRNTDGARFRNDIMLYPPWIRRRGGAPRHGRLRAVIGLIIEQRRERLSQDEEAPVRKIDALSARDDDAF